MLPHAISTWIVFVIDNENLVIDGRLTIDPNTTVILKNALSCQIKHLVPGIYQNLTNRVLYITDDTMTYHNIDTLGNDQQNFDQ